MSNWWRGILKFHHPYNCAGYHCTTLGLSQPVPSFCDYVPVRDHSYVTHWEMPLTSEIDFAREYPLPATDVAKDWQMQKLKAFLTHTPQTLYIHLPQFVTTPKNKTSSRVHLPFVLGSVRIPLQSPGQSSSPSAYSCLPYRGVCLLRSLPHKPSAYNSLLPKNSTQNNTFYIVKASQLPINTMFSRILL